MKLKVGFLRGKGVRVGNLFMSRELRSVKWSFLKGLTTQRHRLCVGFNRDYKPYSRRDSRI
jgi:hypothetical protein